MVNSINSGGSSFFQFNQSTRQVSTLTDDKKNVLNGILEKYDSKKSTSDTMKAMMDEIKEAGFTPEDGSKDLIEAAGFKMPEPPKEGQMPMPPAGGPGPKDEMQGYIKEFLDKKTLGSISQDDIDSLVEKLKSAGSQTSGTIVDSRA